MSTQRYLQSHIAYPSRKSEPPGPYGRPPCRVCGGVVKPPKRELCSKECQQAVWLSCSVGAQRRAVYKRDRGVCSNPKCRMDTGKLDRVFQYVKYREAEFPVYSFWERVGIAHRAAKAMGFRDSKLLRKSKPLWEMDHIVRVADGGGIRPGMSADEILSNLRTLCVPCHAGVTARQGEHPPRAKGE